MPDDVTKIINKKVHLGKGMHIRDEKKIRKNLNRKNKSFHD